MTPDKVETLNLSNLISKQWIEVKIETTVFLVNT